MYDVIKVNGVVIDKRDLLNGDREIIVFLDSGYKLRLFIKGITKSKKREILGTDLLSYSEFIFGKSNFVSKVSLIKSFSSDDLCKTKLSLYLAKVVNYVLQYGNRDKDLFGNFISALQDINEEQVRKLIINIIEREGISNKAFVTTSNFNKDIALLEEYLDNNLEFNIRFGEFMSYV